jgi:hypothetical protein
MRQPIVLFAPSPRLQQLCVASARKRNFDQTLAVAQFRYVEAADLQRLAGFDQNGGIRLHAEFTPVFGISILPPIHQEQ